MRRLIPYLLIPLTLLATGLAGAPWMRAFPAAVLAVPLFGAAALSVLLPLITVPLLSRRLWLTALIDLVAFVLYSLLVVLRSLGGLGELRDGLVDGPSQLLTFALPLVSPRSLLVAPVALTWLVGAIAGECLARRWTSVVPYAGWLVGFGLAFAGTERAVTDQHDGRLYSTMLGGGLLIVLLVLRTTQAWLSQERGAEATQAEGVLPTRGLLVGVLVAVLVGALAAGVIQAPAFKGQATTPQRTPPVNTGEPLTPLAFVAGMRPTDPRSAGTPVFTVNLNAAAPRYVGIANVDFYSGDGWSFDRTFRPSGGVVPAETDPALASPGAAVEQRYRILSGPLTTAPWMPAMYRPQKVDGLTVNVDAESGMVVPATSLRPDDSYSVRSTTALTAWADLPALALPATSTPPIDTQLPGELRTELATIVTGFGNETGVSPTQPVQFLQAVQADLQKRYSLSGPGSTASPSAPSSATSSASSSASASGSASDSASSSGSGSPTPSNTAAPAQRAGGTSFADVLASVLGTSRTGTPEQYATLVALIARQLGVPARVETGFRFGSSTTPVAQPGSYTVTTAQAWSWVEIPVRDVGWVVLDAAPGSYSSDRPDDTAGAQPSPSSSAPPTQNALITTGNAGHAVAPKSDVPGGKGGPTLVSVIALVAIIVGLLLLAGLLFLALRKMRRRRRRRGAPDPRRRLLGAWRESLDMLAEAGLPQLSTLTSTEAANATGARFGTESGGQLLQLGRAANVAMYTTSRPISPEDAAHAWQLEGDLRRMVHGQLQWRDRAAAALAYYKERVTKAPVGPASWASARREEQGRPAERSRFRRLRRGKRRRK